MLRKIVFILLTLILLLLSFSCVNNTGSLLIVSKPIDKVEISVNNDTYKTPYVVDIEKGNKIKISTATETAMNLESWFPGEDTKAIFKRWSGCASSTSNAIEFVPEFGDKLVANFEPIEFKVIYIEKFVTNTGIDVQENDYWYSCGENIEFEPSEYENFDFVCWRVQDSSELEETISLQNIDSSLVLEIKTPIIVEAVYEAENFATYERVTNK